MLNPKSPLCVLVQPLSPEVKYRGKACKMAARPRTKVTFLSPSRVSFPCHAGELFLNIIWTPLFVSGLGKRDHLAELKGSTI